MFDRLFSEIIDRGVPNIYISTLHKPYRNSVSINFCESLGFNFIDEVKDHEDRTWGVYSIESDE